jgi:hypothetical protein
MPETHIVISFLIFRLTLSLALCLTLLLMLSLILLMDLTILIWFCFMREPLRA